jgi:hypothetical protein
VSQELLWLRKGTIRDFRGSGTSAVGSRYQRTGEKTAGQEDSVVSVLVNCGVCIGYITTVNCN